jgi:hypothetical protein
MATHHRTVVRRFRRACERVALQRLGRRHFPRPSPRTQLADACLLGAPAIARVRRRHQKSFLGLVATNGLTGRPSVPTVPGSARGRGVR